MPRKFASVPNLEFHVTEADRVECVVLPGDDDSAFVDWGADFESDAIVREEDELGGVPDAEHLWVIEELRILTILTPIPMMLTPSKRAWLSKSSPCLLANRQ